MSVIRSFVVRVGLLLALSGLAGPAAAIVQQNPPPARGAKGDLEAEYDKGEALAAAGKLTEARKVFEAAAARRRQS